MQRLINFNGSPVLGVFATCTEDLVLVSRGIGSDTIKNIEESLEVPAIETLIDGSTVIGSLTCGNSNGIIISKHALDVEIALIERRTKYIKDKLKIARIPGTMNAAGNIILANDTTAIVHPDLPDKALKVIVKTLDVDVYKGTIGGLKIVGMAAVATNKGVLVHPRVSETEIGLLEKAFDLPVDIGTVNFGSPLIGSALLANTNGYVVGSETTGYELGRIEDALGFI